MLVYTHSLIDVHVYVHVCVHVYGNIHMVTNDSSVLTNHADEKCYWCQINPEVALKIELMMFCLGFDSWCKIDHRVCPPAAPHTPVGGGLCHHVISYLVIIHHINNLEYYNVNQSLGGEWWRRSFEDTHSMMENPLILSRDHNDTIRCRYTRTSLTRILGLTRILVLHVYSSYT